MIRDFDYRATVALNRIKYCYNQETKRNAKKHFSYFVVTVSFKKCIIQHLRLNCL